MGLSYCKDNCKNDCFLEYCCPKTKSIKSQFKDFELLIGLKYNESLPELNAILQCLCHIRVLADYFKYYFEEKIEKISSYNSSKKNGLCITDEFKDIIEKIWPNNLEQTILSKEENSDKFLKMLFKIFSEDNINGNCCLLELILNRLHEELNEPNSNNDDYEQNINIDKSNYNSVMNDYVNKFKKENKSKISDNFFGTLLSIASCPYCQGYKYYPEKFSYLSFSLNEVLTHKLKCLQCYNKLYNGFNSFDYNIYEINIYDCLQYEQCPKLLKCKECSKENVYTKKEIMASPLIFIFIFNAMNLGFTKYKIMDNINIGKIVTSKGNNNVYNLIGVIFKTLDNKYQAYCKSPINNKWYYYGDSNVQQINDIQTLFNNYNYPYMLFYKNS